MTNIAVWVALGFFAIGLGHLANGAVGYLMPGPLVSRWIVLLVIGVPTCVGCSGLAIAILSGTDIGQGGPLGLDLAEWFIFYVVAQSVGTWTLVAYRAWWLWRHWGEE